MLSIYTNVYNYIVILKKQKAALFIYVNVINTFLRDVLCKKKCKFRVGKLF